MEYPAHSFRLDVRCPDYLAPLLGFVGDELGEVGRRARKHRRAQIGNPRLHLGISEPSVYLFVEFVDYLRRRALGRTEAAPEARFVAPVGSRSRSGFRGVPPSASRWSPPARAVSRL